MQQHLVPAAGPVLFAVLAAFFPGNFVEAAGNGVAEIGEISQYCSGHFGQHLSGQTFLNKGTYIQQSVLQRQSVPWP